MQLYMMLHKGCTSHTCILNDNYCDEDEELIYMVLHKGRTSHTCILNDKCRNEDEELIYIWCCTRDAHHIHAYSMTTIAMKMRS